MSTHRLKRETNECFFVTFACFRKKPLIDLADAYDSFYKWFDVLKKHHIPVLGYVIMPNHFHGVIFLPDHKEKPKTINQVLANGKRFISYAIINGLEKNGREQILKDLRNSLSASERSQGKQHKVFTTSSDIQEIQNIDSMHRVLEYIHHNPKQKHWNLVDDICDYPHSSVLFYEENLPNPYLTHFLDVF